MMMVLYKIARTSENPTNIDNYVDTCGYGALAGEQVPTINELNVGGLLGVTHEGNHY